MSIQLSIIIPLYNSEKTIKDLLDSLLAMKTQSVEIILVDDGSTDNSLKICKEYESKDERIIVLQKENGGVSSARNLGLDSAHGEYVYFCDSDDTVFADVLDEAVNKKNIGVDAFIFDFTYHFLEKDETIKSRFKLKSNVVLSKEYIVSQIISPLVLREGTDLASTCNKLFRRELIENHHIRFDKGIYRGEDWRFVLDYLTFAESAYYIPKVIFDYHLDGSQQKSKYKVATGKTALGSIKRKLALNEQFHLGAEEKQLIEWYCYAINEVIVTVKKHCNKSVVFDMLLDPVVQEAAEAVNHYSGKDLISFEVSRKFKIYSFLICKKMYNSFVVLCKRL